MICETPCKNCNRKGLPILFTRYGVAYAAQPSRATTLKTLTPSGNLEATPGNVKLGQAFYNLRLLRAGFLYIRIQRPKQPVEWLGYAVHPQGYLTAFDAGFPSSARAHMACKRDQRQANASLVWIADALKVEKLQYLFSPDPLNPEHLNKEINVKPDAHMQTFDVAGWAGGSRNAKHSCQPGQLNSQVVEFSALSSEAVQQAFESQLYGLMGSNAQERGWGDWEEDVMDISPEVFGAEYQAASSSTRTVKHRGPSYAAAHGERLKQMAAFLQTHQGAVVACHDAFGITQELGHAFPEAQVAYTHWQLQQAQGQATGVTNEWVYQTAVGARSLQDLLKKNAIQTTEQHIKEWNERITNNPVPVYYPDLETKTREEARRKATIARNQQLARQQAAKKTEEVFTKLFDETAAGTIIQAQGSAYKSQQDKLAELGKDHNAWIASSMFEHTIAHYSAKDAHIALAGGGAALSLQLAQCLSGLETNREGLQVLRGMDLYGSNALARLISFNSAALLAVLKQMDATAQKATTLPGAEPTTEWADFMADILVKPVAANFGLGDKALGFIEAVPAAGVSGQLRKKRGLCLSVPRYT